MLVLNTDLEPACISPVMHLTLGRKRRWRGNNYVTVQMLPQCASQHHDIMDQHRGMVGQSGGRLSRLRISRKDCSHSYTMRLRQIRGYDYCHLQQPAGPEKILE